MAYKLSQLSLKIELVYDKPPFPGWQDPRRTIQVHSLYWIHEGTGVFTLEGREMPVCSGNLFYLAPGRKLWMTSSTGNPLHMTMILFQAAVSVYEREQWRVEPLKSLELGEFQTFGEEDREDVEGGIKAVRASWAPGDEWSEAAAHYQLLKLLKRIRRRQTSGEHFRDERKRAFQQAKQVLDTCYFTEIRLTDLAQRCGVSLRALRQQFLQELKLSPKEYLDYIRNEHALRLLQHTDESLKWIAAACGYYDEFHFSKCFKKRNGVSPSRFRSGL